MRQTTIGTGDRARSVSRLALGAMRFGTTTDEATSYAILDAYVEAGGTFVDTSGNYAFWVNGTQGGESELLLGRWLAATGMADRLTIATKVGGRPLEPARSFDAPLEGLEPRFVRESAERSLERMGLDRIDLYYAHVPDPTVPLDDQLAAFAGLVDDGLVDLLGVSNHYAWQVERARQRAAMLGLPAYDVLQYAHSYLRGRTDNPTPWSAHGQNGAADGGLLSLVEDDPALTLVAYSPLLNGAYTNPDKQVPGRYDHPGSDLRRAALATVAAETGRTANEVVLAWLAGGAVPSVPLVGASSVAQVQESITGIDLELTDEQRATLDGADGDASVPRWLRAGTAP